MHQVSPPPQPAGGAGEAGAGPALDAGAATNRVARPDSEILEDLQTSAATIRTIATTRTADSDVFDFIEENGRTYHSYKAGRYFQPNDKREQCREYTNHNMWLLTLDRRLFLSPVEQVFNVLDLGTGVGLWAIEVANAFPGARVIGNDLSPIQPDLVPTNCEFEVEDIEDFPWLYSQKFDLIHGRLLGTTLDDPERVIQEAVDALAPGGWLEFQDTVPPIRCDDGSWEGTNVQRWNEVLLDCFRKAKRPLHAHRLRELFEGAGLVDVAERHFAWPTSPWARGVRNKDLGHLWVENLAREAAESASLALLTRYGGFSRQEALVFAARVTEDLANTNIHVYHPAIVCMGRKRRPGEEPPSTARKTEGT